MFFLVIFYLLNYPCMEVSILSNLHIIWMSKKLMYCVNFLNVTLPFCLPIHNLPHFCILFESVNQTLYLHDIMIPYIICLMGFSLYNFEKNFLVEVNLNVQFCSHIVTFQLILGHLFLLYEMKNLKHNEKHMQRECVRLGDPHKE